LRLILARLVLTEARLLLASASAAFGFWCAALGLACCRLGFRAALSSTLGRTFRTTLRAAFSSAGLGPALDWGATCGKYVAAKRCSGHDSGSQGLGQLGGEM